nr:sensor histidine kinase [Candidatus Sigynarchaeota archaeon]
MKYSQERPRITISALNKNQDGGKSSENDEIEFTVSDNGVGIDNSFLPEIFNRFTRSERTKHIPGTGLGLSIAREIVSLHGGTITVTSRLGAGTVVTVKLPAHPMID